VTVRLMLSRSVVVATCVAMLAAIASEGLGLVWGAMFVLGIAGWVITEPRWRTAKTSQGVVSTDHAWEGLPRWIANIMVVLALLASAARALAGDAPVSVFMTFLGGMIVVKLWQHRELRDAGQLLTLSLFLTLGSTLNRNDVDVGLSMIVQAPVLLAGAMLFQMCLAKELAHKTGTTSDDPAGLRAHSPTDPAREWTLLRRPLVTSFLSALSVATTIGIILFLITPRGIGLIDRLGSFAQPTIGRVSGLSSQIDLNQGGLISQSPRIILTATLHEQRSHATLGGDERLLYLRAIVLDSYARGRWISTPGQPTTLRKLNDIPNEINNQVTLGNSSSPFSETQLIINVISPLRARSPLLTLWRPTGISLAVGATIEHTPGPELLAFIKSEGDRPVTSYTIDQVSQPLLAAGSQRGEITWPDDVISAAARAALRPAGIDPNPATREIDSDAATVRVLESWLRSNCQYTLEPPIPPVGQDPIAWFLQTSKLGHCEYFASALAAMVRSVGIDARVVGGYLTNEFDEQRQHYIVRDSDAHAWIEAEVAPGTWRTFDATPESRAEYRRPAPSGMFAFFANVGSGINNFWNTNVVSFDKGSQERLLGLRTENRAAIAQSTIGKWLASFNDTAGPEATLHALAKLVQRITVVLTLFVLAMVGLLLLFRLLRARRSGATRDGWSFQSSWKLRRDRARILRAARKAGVTKLPHESLAMLARRVGDPVAQQLLLERTRLIYAARFAPAISPLPPPFT
jgi:protein-glutamine gamma-glutamyltransferase